MYELSGILKEKKDARQVSDTFKVREFVVTDNSSQYPQHILMQVTQDRCDLLDALNPGDEVKVGFYLRGREWTNPEGEVRYFNSIDAWRVEKVATQAGSPAPDPTMSNAQTIESTENAFDGGSDDDDDLPF